MVGINILLGKLTEEIKRGQGDCAKWEQLVGECHRDYGKAAGKLRECEAKLLPFIRK